MDATVKKQWVDALRAGTYQQGKTYLRKDNEFCCLGVLCDLLNVPFTVLEENSLRGVAEYGETKEMEYLPRDVGEKVDLSEQGQETLAHMNDGGDSFKLIASYIEETF